MPSDDRVGSFDRYENEVGEAQLQSRWDGLVVPVAPGLGAADAIDPSTTSTPIADARDAIQAVAGGGDILLPPETTITEAAPLTGLERIGILGSRARSPTIEFTDLTADGIQIGGTADGQGAYIDGVILDGSDLTNRTGGSAIHFTGATPFFNLGRVSVTNWIDPVIHMDTGHPFESKWYQVYGFNYEGRLLFMQDAGEPLHIGSLVPGPESPETSVHVNYPGGFLRVDHIAHRADKQADRALYAEVAGDDAVHINLLDFETSATGSTEAVQVDGRGRLTIDECRLIGDFSVDDVYLLDFEPDRIDIPEPTTSSAFSATNIVNVADDTQGYVNYDGPASDITNSSATSPLSFEVECRGPNFTG